MALQKDRAMKTTEVFAFFVFIMCVTVCQTWFGEAAPIHPAFEPISTDSNSSVSISETVEPLPPPIATGNFVELCLNSRYSEHSLTGTASIQQLSNVLYGAGKAPITGAYRNIYVATQAATYLYDPNNHSLLAFG